MIIQEGRKFAEAAVVDGSRAVHNTREFSVNGEHVVCHGCNHDKIEFVFEIVLPYFSNHNQGTRRRNGKGNEAL